MSTVSGGERQGVDEAVAVQLVHGCIHDDRMVLSVRLFETDLQAEEALVSERQMLAVHQAPAVDDAGPADLAAASDRNTFRSLIVLTAGVEAHGAAEDVKRDRVKPAGGDRVVPGVEDAREPGKPDFLAFPRIGDQGRHPLHLLRGEVRTVKRPRVLAAQPVRAFEQAELQVRAPLRQAQGAQGVRQPAAGKDNVERLTMTCHVAVLRTRAVELLYVTRRVLHDMAGIGNVVKRGRERRVTSAPTDGVGHRPAREPAPEGRRLHDCRLHARHLQRCRDQVSWWKNTR